MSHVSDVALKDAIVHSEEHSAYPESEEVSSAIVKSNLLPEILADLNKARDAVKITIRDLSRDVAPDVDGWIAQAKKLQVDIERSKATAREIVQQAEAGKRLKAGTHEAKNKAGLLEKEVAFNEVLLDTLERIRKTDSALQACQDATARSDIPNALEAYEEATACLSDLAAVDNTRAVNILAQRSRNLKAALIAEATQKLEELVKVSVADRRVLIAGDSDAISLMVETISRLGELPGRIHIYLHKLEAAILQPLLSHPTTCRIIKDGDNAMSTVSQEIDSDVNDILEDIWVVLEFLHTRLPRTFSSPLSEALVPELIENLRNTWLDNCVPTSIDDMPEFQRLLDGVLKLATRIDDLQWPTNASLLREWVQSAPRTWIAKRREVALGAVRTLLFTRLHDRKTVERVETRMVSKGESMMGTDQTEGDDAWEAEWGEGDATSPFAAEPSNESGPAPDDEDASAWDIEDEETNGADEAGSDEADADAWGWGDGDENQSEQANSAVERSAISARKSAAAPVPRSSNERELTLSETFTATAIPDGIIDIIERCVADAVTLANPTYAQTPIGPAASALYTLPTFALAMYRATASTAYGRLDTGNMLIYNDGSRLADQLRTFVATQIETDSTSELSINMRPSARLKLDKDIQALDAFARRAYSAEMEAQRTILGDMLDGAQGFVNCTVQPFSSACESAVDIATGRLRDVHKQWQPILSRSALLQSVGSLLASVTSKMILDIEDLSDIGEEESKKLRSLCDRVSEIKQLFIQEHAEGGQSGDMTGIYCPNWFKFQYLAEILESSLADIKYLWTEGELRLDFDVDEVVDLVQALFAESDYRRKAIADIRRSAS